MKVDSNEHSYDYDKLYQLINVDYPGASGESFYYDKLGNRTSTINGSTIEYETNNLNQYTSVDGYEMGLHDDNGNMLSYRMQGVTSDYTYDCENRLTSAVRGGGTTVYYKYDYLGRLVKRTQGANTSKYVYSGDQIVAEYDGSNNLVRKFIYGAGIDEPVCMIVGSSTYYYHYDGLGSVVALSDSSKTIVEKYSYDVFGAPTILSPNNELRTTSLYGNPYMFTGRQYDAQAQVYYYRARFYSPALGRFLQPDPVMQYMQIAAAGLNTGGKIPGSYLSGAALQNYLLKDSIGRFLLNDSAGRFLVAQTLGVPAELNLYTYCGNNPIMLLDPYGLGWKSVAGKITIAFGLSVSGAGVALKAPGVVVAGGGIAAAGILLYGSDLRDAGKTIDNAVKPVQGAQSEREKQMNEAIGIGYDDGGKGCPPK